MQTLEGDLEVPWGCCPDKFSDSEDLCIDIPEAENKAIGYGLQNTLAILDVCNEPNIAARLCSDYIVEYEGVMYDDWYLPSLNEIRKMNIDKEYILDHGDTYWTSSQGSYNNYEYAEEVFGWVDQCGPPYNPSEGCWHVGNLGGMYKSDCLKVRAVRSF
nr:hypothetical protein [uncultured Allomuricauda sp.]